MCVGHHDIDDNYKVFGLIITWSSTQFIFSFVQNNIWVEIMKRKKMDYKKLLKFIDKKYDADDVTIMRIMMT